MATGKKTGGRKKGTPNKITALAKGMMMKWLEAHCATTEEDDYPIIMQDFIKIGAKDRMRVTTEFIKIIMPKNISIEDGDVRLTIEDKLIALSGGELPKKTDDEDE